MAAKRAHLQFLLEEDGPKTQIFSIVSQHDKTELGRVFWHWSWRQYVFEPTVDEKTIWSDSCLKELFDFLQDLRAKKQALREGKG